MLVNLKPLIEYARANRTAVACVNVFGFEDALACREAAEAVDMPVILSAAKDLIEWMPLKIVSAMLRDLAENSSVPVCVHLDHCYDINIIRQALDCGFTSVMYDGSQLAFDENVTRTAAVVEMAKSYNAGVEGEIGSVAYLKGRDHIRHEITDVNRAVEFYKQTKVDIMAVSVGNVHRLESQQTSLRFDLLESISQKTNAPLCIHGVSGVYNADLQRLAFETNVVKLNVGTVFRMEWGNRLRDLFQQNPDSFDHFNGNNMKKVNIGVVGLGRLGICHCENLLRVIPSANVTAACSIVPKELEKAKQLGVPNIYNNYRDMLQQVDIEAVVISTSTNMHAEHIIQALDHNKHVFCEKPLAIQYENCAPVLKKASEKPGKTVQIGFVRRFDATYMEAYKKIQEGHIGKVYRVHSQTSDWTEFAEFQVKFSQTSGGIFHDYNIHDIDLIHWLAGSRFKSVHSIGGSYKYPEFGKMGSADNTICLAELENGAFATITASRTEPHGHGTHTIIYGTEGTLAVGLEPSSTRPADF
ncbi:hypothetical protein CHS0354_035194 [Potamilus streckersoni]|uniref:Uncharacterized protein n=1 Tax=Potamilus streckersoni TaxID=2493646 RepID=A0AAE0S2R9_9BIVA|nr:hypothetical protein CHS0354_035194 [Potamilus streckersoni]